MRPAASGPLLTGAVLPQVVVVMFVMWMFVMSDVHLHGDVDDLLWTGAARRKKIISRYIADVSLRS